jgi:hypothetical protein
MPTASQRGVEATPVVEQLREELLRKPEIRVRVARRAYEIYESRGGAAGRDVDDWLAAEGEILSVVEEESQRSMDAVQSTGATTDVERQGPDVASAITKKLTRSRRDKVSATA